MRDLFSLEGKKALVTGASRGLGYSIALGLASFGADVSILARDRARLEKARAGLEKTGKKIFAFTFDMENTPGIAQIFEKINAEAGPVDILVNNAGINIRAALTEAKDIDFDRIMAVNLKSVFELSRCFARERISRNRPGRIINITSLAAEAARENIGIYTAAKGALKLLTKSCAVEWARYRINTNAIGPGYFKTPMNAQLAADAQFDSWVKEKSPAGRWGNADELIGAAVFLSSDASNYVNGQTIYVDGGWLAKL